MSDPDRLRRAATALVVAAALLLVPAVATAKFTDVEQPSLSVSTARMATPTAVTGSYTCATNANSETLAVNVTGFGNSGPAASSFTYRLSAPGAVTVTQTTTAHALALNGSKPDDKQATTWTISIQSVLGGWTGDPWSKAVTCERKASSTGSL